MSDRPVLIIGAGTIGLSIGWQIARQGRAVEIFERDVAGRGTSWMAAGMLAPDAEIEFEELDLYRLNRESLRRWSAFAASLEADSGLGVDLRREGTLLVADDRDAAEALRRRFDFMLSHGLNVQWLSGDQALELEPFVAPRLSAAVYSPGDFQVDNRLLVDALKQAFLARGGVLHEHSKVMRIEPHRDRPALATADGNRVEGDSIVIAAGVWSRQIDGMERETKPPVRPVKGQMIELRVEAPFDLKHVVRGPGAYVVPKSSGRLLVGATSEEMGFDDRVTAGGLYVLLEGAWEIVPGIYDLPVTDTWAGLRPASRDHLPIVGAAAAPGIVMATGFYRHGILLTPVTAEEVARHVLTGETSEWVEPFLPTRFSSM